MLTKTYDSIVSRTLYRNIFVSEYGYLYCFFSQNKLFLYNELANSVTPEGAPHTFKGIMPNLVCIWIFFSSSDKNLSMGDEFNLSRENSRQ